MRDVTIHSPLFRILHANGFSAAELTQQKMTIYSNIVSSIAALVNAMLLMGIDYGSRDRNVS
jgi:hypothetical protein